MPPSPPDLHNYLKQLLDNARLRGFQERQGKSDTDLELLADLQHQGAATCLIDFTTNALIALWFACEERSDQPEPAGKVVALATGALDRFSIVTSQDLKKPIETFLNQRTWKWDPSHLSTRIVAQQSVFVFGTGTIDKTHYESIEIDGGSKGTIRGELQERFGIMEQYLFSDFPGFALSHAHDRPYRGYGYTREDYFSRGLTSQQQGDHKKAKEFYDQALELDPTLIAAYNNRGSAKHDLGQHEAAIADYSQAIKLNPTALAYSNRGNAKADLGQHEAAIADYSQAIKLNPTALAYSNRGNAKADLGQHEKALDDFDQAIKLNPTYALAYNNRGNVKNGLGQHERAIADLDQAIALNPALAEAYYNRGTTKEILGRISKARADYQPALVLAQEAGNEKLVAKVKDALRRLDNDEEP